ncbi:MAG: cob(I)yrinic acid a,c-diamide adenosyltransferase [Candidatus Woesebacteria bacterium]
MISVYTKTGDKGESGLANGQRLGKDELIFEVLGTLDELNSHVGLCVVKVTQETILLEIQDTLFHIGAEIAGSHKTKLEEKKIQTLEGEIDRLQSLMEDNWYQKFLLPGGSEPGAYLDIARTVCRRCERLVVVYSKQTPVSTHILHYMNRLSDYLYVLRCFVNHSQGIAETIFDSTGSYTKNLEQNLKKSK